MIAFTSVPHRRWKVLEVTKDSGGCWGGDAEECPFPLDLVLGRMGMSLMAALACRPRELS